MPVRIGWRLMEQSLVDCTRGGDGVEELVYGWYAYGRDGHVVTHSSP
jgi:hypothetical protein